MHGSLLLRAASRGAHGLLVGAVLAPAILALATLTPASLASAGLAFAAPAAEGRIADRVAATVNDELITLSQVYELGTDYIEEAVTASGESMRHPAEHAVLERLIERALIDQQIQALKLDVTEQDIDRAVDDLARRNGLDRDGVRAELERQGMAWDAYREELRSQLRDMKFQQAVLRPRVTISEDELRDAYLRQGGSLGGEQVSLQGILLALPPGSDAGAVEAVRTRAADIVGRLKAGEDFAKLASEFDEGPYKATGGEMGKFQRGELAAALDTAVFSAAVGVPTLVETPGALVILRVKEKARVDTGLEAVREKLTDQIFGSRMEQEKQRWFEQARRAAIVRVMLPGGDGTGPRSGAPR